MLKSIFEKQFPKKLGSQSGLSIPNANPAQITVLINIKQQQTAGTVLIVFEQIILNFVF